MKVEDSKGKIKTVFSATEVAESWQKQDTFATDGECLYQWQDTHWCKLLDLDAAALAMHELLAILAGAEQLVTIANAKHSVAAAKLYLLPDRPMGTRTTRPLIPLLNGYYDAEADELLSIDKDAWLQHVVLCEYDPNAEAPVFTEDYLISALPDFHVRQRVQEHIGTCLIQQPFGLNQLWQGAGAGPLARILQVLIGNAEIHQDKLNRWRLASLIAESAGYDSVAPRSGINSLVHTQLGTRTSRVNLRHITPSALSIAGKEIALGDTIPRLNDQSAAYWSAWDAVPFSDAPDVTDHVIEHELAGVFMWALEGLRRVLERGGHAERPAGIRPIVTQAKFDTAHIEAWARDRHVQVRPGTKTVKSLVYADYCRWCDAQALAPLSDISFWKLMKEVRPTAKSRKSGAQEIRVVDLRIGLLEAVQHAA